jgi:hypothetical protein
MSLGKRIVCGRPTCGWGGIYEQQRNMVGVAVRELSKPGSSVSYQSTARS